MEEKANFGNESRDSSNSSLSDSWTVLDSSHLKEDGDLSDAESVEVLANEDPHLVGKSFCDCKASEEGDESKVPEELEDETASVGPENNQNDCKMEDLGNSSDSEEEDEDDAPSVFGEEAVVDPNDAAATAAMSAAGVAVAAALASIPLTTRGQRLKFLHFLGQVLLALIFAEFLLRVALRITETYEGGSDAEYLFSPSHGWSHTLSEEATQTDPLTYQLHHVLAEWKKSSVEEYSANRQLLKVLLAYFAQDELLASHLQEFAKIIQEHDEATTDAAKYFGTDNLRYNRMVVTGHLAHSTMAILSNKYVPIKVSDGVNVSAKSERDKTFAPEPGYWLKDHYVLAHNETFYSYFKSMKVVPPMYNLYLHLGSPKWNQYFWDLYLRDDSIKSSDTVEEVGNNTVSIDEHQNFKSDFTEDSDKPCDVPKKTVANRPADQLKLSINEKDVFEGPIGKLITKLDEGEIVDKICVTGNCRQRDEGKPKEPVKKEKKGNKVKYQGKKEAGEPNKVKHQGKGKRDNRKSEFEYKSADNIKSNYTKKKGKDRSSSGASPPKKANKFKESKLKYKVDDDTVPQKQRKNQNPDKGKKRMINGVEPDDWNTRMARGREKLRGFRNEEDDWIFKRAKARQDMRDVYTF